MTPEEKAKELVYKFMPNVRGLIVSEHRKYSKDCALIAVDEILTIMESDDKENLDCYWINSGKYKYWEQVKAEINKL